MHCIGCIGCMHSSEIMKDSKHNNIKLNQNYIENSLRQDLKIFLAFYYVQKMHYFDLFTQITVE